MKYYQKYIDTPPTNREEAYQKWEALSRALQLLAIAYQMDEKKIDQAIRISTNEKL